MELDESYDLAKVEIARYEDKDFLYQAWEDDGDIEVNVVAETHLDGDNEYHRNNTMVKGVIEDLGGNYAWSPSGINKEDKEVRVVGYNDGFTPERESIEDAEQASEVEQILESGFNR